ncbi:MAG: calycin-like domain-containing protein [Bacteroidia bacterium]|nr:calycin-like domain-containing protein [Bacteroidia bacterium]
MRHLLISMLAIASTFSLLCTACDDDDDEPKKKIIDPIEPFRGKADITAFKITIPTDMSISVNDVKDNTFSLVVDEFTINIPMGNNTISKTLKTFKVENVNYTEKDGVATILPGEFETTDGVYASIKVNILAGIIANSNMYLSFTVQPEGMPMPMEIDFTTAEEE